MTKQEKATALMALDDSVKHWERVLDGKDTCATDEQCSLCRKYITDMPYTHCEICPLSLFGMRCYSERDPNPDPYREFTDNIDAFEIPQPADRTPKEQEVIVNMLTALLFVREAVTTEKVRG